MSVSSRASIGLYQMTLRSDKRLCCFSSFVVVFLLFLILRSISGAVLGHCGFSPIRRRALYSAKDSSTEQRAVFLASVIDTVTSAFPRIVCQ
jgi:hypothetical protein